MRIALPIAEGKLTMHFGHCEQFALIDVDPEAKEITSQRAVDAPPHQPGLLPKWLAEQGANVIIASGMGGRALALFADQQIEVIIGVSAGLPEEIVRNYLAGELQAGSNVCDH